MIPSACLTKKIDICSVQRRSFINKHQLRSGRRKRVRIYSL